MEIGFAKWKWDEIFGSGEVINLSGNKHEKDETQTSDLPKTPNLNLGWFDIIPILRSKMTISVKINSFQALGFCEMLK